MTISPGTKLGAYEIITPIGKGGMGEVYRTRDTNLKRELAIKLLPSEIVMELIEGQTLRQQMESSRNRLEFQSGGVSEPLSESIEWRSP